MLPAPGNRGTPLGKSADGLTRPLSDLIELGYVRKEVPFDEVSRSSERTFYRLDDPILSFFFKFLPPNESLLELGAVSPVESSIKKDFASHVAGIWGDLATMSVPSLKLGGARWGAAARWWRPGLRGEPLEFNVVALSLDRKSVPVGEAKWTESDAKAENVIRRPRARVAEAPIVKGRRVLLCAWLKRTP